MSSNKKNGKTMYVNFQIDVRNIKSCKRGFSIGNNSHNRKKENET